MNEPFDILTLDNNMKGVYYRVSSPIVHIGVAIKAGSKYDTISGIAHLLEHMLFKGTQKRKVYHINNFLDTVGGELNAYTHKDEILIYASVRNEYLSRALNLLADILQNAVFPENELAKEKNVIVDEIQSYLDAPAEQIFDDFEELLYAGTPLSHPVLGSVSSLKKISQTHLEQHYHKYFHPENMAFAIVGGVPVEKVKKQIDKYFLSLPPSGKLMEKGHKVDSAKKHLKRFSAKLYKDVHQTHIVLGNTSYHYHHPKRRTLLLLSNMIGGPSLNSLLSKTLREEKGWTYNVEAGVNTYEDDGNFSIYFSCEPNTYKKALSLVHKTLQKLCEGKISGRQFENYKNQLIGHIALSNDNHQSLMLSLCKSMLIFGKVESVEKTTEEIQAITQKQLIEVANEIVHPNKLSQIIYQPKNV